MMGGCSEWGLQSAVKANSDSEGALGWTEVPVQLISQSSINDSFDILLLS